MLSKDHRVILHVIAIVAVDKIAVDCVKLDVYQVLYVPCLLEFVLVHFGNAVVLLE